MALDPKELHAEGERLIRQGQYDQALVSYQQAAQVCYEHKDIKNWITCLCQVGAMLSVLGRDPDAEVVLRRAATKADRLKDPPTCCHAFRCLGDLLRVQGKHVAAVRWLRRAAEAAEADRLTNPMACSAAFRALGSQLSTLGQYAEAEYWLRQAATEADKLNDALACCAAFCTLGDLLSLTGRDAEAERWLQRAVAVADSHKEPLARCNAFKALGNLLSTHGRREEAIHWLQRAATEADKLKDSQTRCTVFRSLGDLLRVQSKYAEAEHWLRRAAAAADKLKNSLTRCNAFRALGNLLRVRDQYPEAEHWLRRSAAAARSIKDPFALCNTFCALGNLLRVQNRYAAAQRWLRRAAIEAFRLEDPLTHATTACGLGTLAFDLRRWEKGRRHLAEAQTHLLHHLSQNRRPEAVGNLMAEYGYLFELGLKACERAGREATSGRADRMWHGLEFADGAKCVAIREGLRRHGRRDSEKEPSVPWRAAPPDRGGLFVARQPAGPGNVLGVHRAVRGPYDLAAVGSAGPAESVLEFPGEIDEAKREYCQPVDRAAVKRLLPDRDTVLVVVFFDGDDLVVLPIRKDAADEPQILHTSAGYFRVPGVLPKLRPLIHKQEGHVLAIADEELGLCGLPADELRREADMTPIYQKLYKVLNLEGLLDLIEPDPERRADLHLVLIPDGPLYRLALHAACKTRESPRLYAQFKSLRYGLSLRTLELQQQIQDRHAEVEAGDRTLRGVAFANPDREVRIRLIEGVIRETQVLVEETNPASWWLHGEREPPDQQAIRANLRERHRAGNIGWTMGHGVDFETARVRGLKDDFILPDGRPVPPEESLLLCDGLVSMSRMLAEGYDLSNWRLFHISACLLGRLRELGASKEVLGYIAVLTLLRCRRVCSALWPIWDPAAPEFTRHWIGAIHRHVFGLQPPGPHAFAVAFKEALDNFRRANNGQFDHEYFWAPYTLYGLG